MTITSISCSANTGLQQQRVRLFGKGRDVEGKLVVEGKVLVVEGGDVEGGGCMELASALELARSKRPIVEPNVGFLHQLGQLEVGASTS